MAVEEGWQRRFPHLDLDRGAIQRLVGVPVLTSEVLQGGLRNTNYRVRLAGEPRPVVLRLYTADARACAREAALLRLVADRVPVPGVLGTDSTATPPWTLLELVDGVRFDQMLAGASTQEVESSCRSAGEVLAAIHSFTFAQPGFLGASLEIAEPMGFPWLTGVAEFFARDATRQLVGSELADNVVRLVERESWQLADVWTQARLVHADYKPWNLLVQARAPGDWRVSAALDWEFSLSGPPLCDLGIFLRYADRMPSQYVSGFLAGYSAAGGTLPDNVRDLARLIDLVSLWTFLERAGDDSAVLNDVKPVLAATVDAFSR